MGSRDPTYPLLPIISLLGAFLVMIPFPWHLQPWNAGTCFYMIWVFAVCLNQFVNAIVWRGDTSNHAPIWCDISIRISMAAALSIPLCSMCIMRRLHNIATATNSIKRSTEKWRGVIIDGFLCLLLPLVFSALQLINQNRRFDIYEDIGCYSALYNTAVLYLTFYIWPLVISLVSAIYCVLTLFAIRHRQFEFSRLMGSDRSLTMSRYIRLICFVMLQSFLIILASIFFMIVSATARTIEPWISFEDTHIAFTRVEMVSASTWKQNTMISASLELGRWLTPFLAFMFFAFFGFAEEARMNYKKSLDTAAHKLGAHRINFWKSGSFGRNIPRALKLQSFESSSPKPPQPIICFVVTEHKRVSSSYFVARSAEDLGVKGDYKLSSNDFHSNRKHALY